MKPLYWILLVGAILLIAVGVIALTGAPKRKHGYYASKNYSSDDDVEKGINYKASTKSTPVVRAKARY